MSQSKYLFPPVTLCLFTMNCSPAAGLIGAVLLCPVPVQHVNVLGASDPIHHLLKHLELSGWAQQHRLGSCSVGAGGRPRRGGISSRHAGTSNTPPRGTTS